MKAGKKNTKRTGSGRKSSASPKSRKGRKAAPKKAPPKKSPSDKKSAPKAAKEPRLKAPSKKEARLAREKLEAEERKDLARKRNEQNVVKVGSILSNSHIRQTLIQLGGENALSIIKSFYGNQSDDELAKKLKLKISDVRATLNRLHNEGLVNYVREKDNETGWYSYSWSLNMIRIEKWVGEQSCRIGDIGISGNNLYFCSGCGATSVVDFESATDMLFRCERCNKMLEFLDEKKAVELLEKRV